MLSTIRAIGAALLFLAPAAPAGAQTAVTAEATVWLTPGVPADSAARMTVRIADQNAPAPGVADRITMYLPREVTLQGAKFPTCALDSARTSGPAGCSPGSQVGSGRLTSVVGPMAAPVTLDAYAINGAEPGQLILYLAQKSGGAQIALVGVLGPSDDPAFGSTLAFAVPMELRHIAGLDNATTEVDLLLRTTAREPFAAIVGCPGGSLPFKGLVAFEGGAALQVAASAACLSGPPPAITAMPQSPSSPADVWPVAERAAAVFGVRIARGKPRRLRLTRVAADAAVSARCVRRCGKAGKELIATVRGATARLKQPLEPRSRFELRVGGADLVTRFARYEVNRRGTAVRRLTTGCLDAAGKQRVCPGRVG